MVINGIAPVQQQTLRKAKTGVSSWVFILISGTLVMLLLGAYIIFIVTHIVALDRTIAQFEERLSCYHRGARNFPTEEKETFLLREQDALKNILSALAKHNLYWRDVIVRYSIASSPLQFKEQIYATRQRLARKAKSKGVRIGEDFGFNEWQNKLPPPERLGELFQGLSLVEKILGEAMNAHITGIDLVTISELKECPYVENGTEPVYYERTVHLTLEGKQASIVAFMQSLGAFEELLFIEDILIERAKRVGKNTGDHAAQEPDMLNEATIIDAIPEEDPLLRAELVLVNRYL